MGAYHQRRTAADEKRDRKLARAGYRVLRLQAGEVLHQLPVTLQRIQAALQAA